MIRSITTTADKNKNSNTEFNSSQGSYRLKKNIGLIEEKYKSEIDPKDILAHKFGYYFVQDSYQVDIDALAVVENQDSGALGILTGIMSVKFKDFSERDIFLQTTDAKLIKEYAHLKTVHLKFDQLTHLFEVDKLAQNNPKVQRVTIEILEYQKVSK